MHDCMVVIGDICGILKQSWAYTAILARCNRMLYKRFLCIRTRMLLEPYIRLPAYGTVCTLAVYTVNTIREPYASQPYKMFNVIRARILSNRTYGSTAYGPVDT